jgi:hypothetical protein
VLVRQRQEVQEVPRGVSAAAAPDLLLRELLVWVGDRPRTYRDTIEAWRSNCPRHPVLDDAFTEGLVRVEDGLVLLTERGQALL